MAYGAAVSIDELGRIIDRAVKALLVSLRESGCPSLNEAEIEKVEAIILASLAKSGAMRVDDEPPCIICGGTLSVPAVLGTSFYSRLVPCPNCCPTADSASG
jgi:hypothetical protein